MSTQIQFQSGSLRDLSEEEFFKRYSCDRFTATVLSNRFGYIVEHLADALLRTAFSPILRDWYDFAATLAGPRSEDYLTTGISNSLVLFVGPMMDAVRNTMEEYGVDRLEPGDVIMCNDSYRTGTHINDLLLSRPVFFEDEIIGFVSVTAHQLDMGGAVPGGFSGTKTNIYENGLVISPRAIYRRNEPVAESFSMILDNVRFGSIIEPDLRNINAALQLGDRLLVESAERHGRDAVLGAMRYTCDAGEERISTAFATLPDGTYEGEDVIDADGIDDGEEYRVKVRILKVGDRAEVDVSGTSRQARTSINASVFDAKTAVIAALKFLFDPRGTFTSGAMRPVDLVIPEGTFLSALPPDGVVFLYYEATNVLLSAIFRALAPALGERAIAGDLGANNNHNASGVLQDGTPWLSSAQAGGEHGPWGATRSGDGESYMTTYLVNGLDPALEAVESDAPLLLTRREAVIDSGGPGFYRGGAAQVKDSLWLRPAVHHSMALRFKVASGFGVNGGADGKTGGVWFWDGDDDAAVFMPLDDAAYRAATAVSGRLDSETNAPTADGDFRYFARQESWATKPMATWRYIVNGGGGWGDPFERDLDRVLVDVRDGYVSIEGAARDYGVVVQGNPEHDPEGLTIDVAATKQLRAGGGE
jgi:N-methylhydantoinase B